MNTLKRRSKKILIGIAGGLVVLLGLVLVPYPGPGWLIVFAGLAILATEFEFASKVLKYARGKYDQWSDWLKKQPLFIRIVVLSLTGLVVLATIYMLNFFGIVNSRLNLDIDWLISPLFR